MADVFFYTAMGCVILMLIVYLLRMNTGTYHSRHTKEYWQNAAPTNNVSKIGASIYLDVRINRVTKTDLWCDAGPIRIHVVRGEEFSECEAGDTIVVQIQ
jgi:hypothetical protein